MSMQRPPRDTNSKAFEAKSHGKRSPKAEASKEANAEWIGTEVRALRKARKMSLQDLSAESGKSIGYLSQLERGISAPTIGALSDVAQALGVQVGWFFPEGTSSSADSGVVVRKQSRRRLAFASGISDFLLSPNLSGALELLWSVMDPGADSGEAYHHEGEESGVVLSGSLELWVGENFYDLHEGDSFAFTSATPHRYRNPGPGKTELVWVVTPPSY